MKTLPPVNREERETPKQRAREIEGRDRRHPQEPRPRSVRAGQAPSPTDWRLQLRRHPRLVAGVGIGVLALVGGLVAVSVAKRRREHPRRRAQRIGLALRRGYENPEKVARPEPSVAVRLLAAVATSVGTSLVKKYVEQAWSARRQGPPAPVPS